nr:hypothetical protein [Halobaculum sp. SYNS20]
MTRWTAFAGLATVVLILLLGLARLSEARVAPHPEPSARDGTGRADDAPEDPGPATRGPSHLGPGDGPDRTLASPERSPVAAAEADASLSAGALLANVALSQGLFGAVLVAAALWADVPAAALGLAPVATATDAGIGVGLGVALWLAARRAGDSPSASASR